jgi:trehalose synthase
MAQLQEVPVRSRPLSALSPYVGEAAVKEGLARAAELAARLGRKPLWNLNSTSVGGGVAEMLPSLLGYARGAGLDARWLVISGSPAFFRITKRLHDALHGQPGDGSPLGPAERQAYEATLREEAAELRSLVRPGEVVILHDPQTVGLAPHLAQLGARVLWRCHIGSDAPGPEAARAWSFLAPDLTHLAGAVFSRPEHVPPDVFRCPVWIIQPSIDPGSTKNRELAPAEGRALLIGAGLLSGSRAARPRFRREDGTEVALAHYADVTQLGPPPTPETPLVLQVSRWDRLKDPVGVLRGFGLLAEREPDGAAELLLAGPNVHGVRDDPGGAAAFGEVLAAWRALPHATRRRVHLACLPTHDVEENAVLVNALQRHAAVVVQKSLREGFGLTVTEAMWKQRPVVASAVGGIRDQLRDGVDGLLLRDPADPAEFESAVRRMLTEPDQAARFGRSARERVRAQFLPLRHLLLYASALEEVLRTTR